MAAATLTTKLARIALELLAMVQLAIQAENAGTDEASRQRAEQERREKEKVVAEVIAASPPVENLYPVELAKPLEIAPPVDLEEVSEDLRKAQEVYRQVLADTPNFKIQRDKIMRDLRLKVLQSITDGTLPRPNRADEAFNTLAKYILE